MEDCCRNLFRSADNWLSQLGISINTSPVDSEDCTPDVPIDRQIRHAIGVEYNWECRLSTGVRIVYSDYGKVKLDNDSLKGDTNEMTFSFSQTRKRDFLKIDGWFQYVIKPGSVRISTINLQDFNCYIGFANLK
jgi:hypothetical protein